MVRDEIRFLREFTKRMGAPPKPEMRINPREYRTFLNSKSNILLEADPEAVITDEKREQWSLKIPAGAGEIRCPTCGNAHKNPKLKATYRVCHHCFFILEPTTALSLGPPSWLRESGKLRILAASYGHAHDASRAIDCTDVVRDAVDATRNERLTILKSDNLARMFGADPAYGARKVVKVRYLMDGRRGELTAWEGGYERHLAEDLYILATKAMPLITIVRAVYGHPLGVIKGRGAFDVTDVLQSRVHLAKGRSVVLKRHEDLTELFGEPCAGRAKCLTIEYEIMGKAGEFYEYELDGKLQNTISIEASPSISPQIIILSATYGWTEQLLAERKKETHRVLFDLQAISERRRMGLAVSAKDNMRLREMPKHAKELKRLNDLRVGFVDVREHIQRRIELAGGAVLFFGGATPTSELPSWARVTLAGRESVGIDLNAVDDLNAIFGNPTPNQTKLLSIDYVIVGHDAERKTEAAESTSSGYESNFINQRKGRLATLVEEDDAGRASCDESILLGIPTILPSIEVRYATYGHPTNPKQVWNVTSEMRALANQQGGQRLHIDTTMSLYDLFGDPCVGMRKKLTIRYYVRGFHGCTTVEERPQNHLATDIALGFIGEGHDPFEQVARRTYRQNAVDKIQKLRILDHMKVEPSPYSHLGRAW